jgi:hypothetical protein
MMVERRTNYGINGLTKVTNSSIQKRIITLNFVSVHFLRIYQGTDTASQPLNGTKQTYEPQRFQFGILNSTLDQAKLK